MQLELGIISAVFSAIYPHLSILSSTQQTSSALLTMMKKVSIIVPTRNEEKNVLPLIEKIKSELVKHDIVYEIIFVDDHSTDQTRNVIEALTKYYPLKLHLKKGTVGKAQSILEGAQLAKYDTLCMIDADLQYPPSAIPEMLIKLGNGADVVIANRSKQKIGVLRKLSSTTFSFFFGKLLHGLSYDIQSGLKVFKKEILQRIELHPTPWTFDLEFLIKAKQAGYRIDTVDIVFQRRRFGKSKVGVLKATIEISFSAIKLKFEKPRAIPFHPKLTRKKGKGFHFNGSEFVHYTNFSLENSAIIRINSVQKIFLILLFEILVLGIILNWHTTIVIGIAVLTTLYFVDLLFNLFLIYRSFSKEPEIQITSKDLLKAHKQPWPRYTIMCPLYKEWQVLPQFIKAIQKLDYPKDKLQVLILLEEDDKETIRKVGEFNLPSSFEIAIIPHSSPKTKPKALNYGLSLSKGEYCVVYDAEDVPDPDQLKKAVLAFKKAGSKTLCIQAKLNFYNPHQNLLTRLFTAEYSLWFDLVLTGLQSIEAPIPLGGTSNHFRTADIIKLHGWDPFNVTEDADLGMRIAKKGFITAVVNSTTMEEANSQVGNWIRQRSRWIKGYMQTYLVHMRRPKEFLTKGNRTHLLTFQLIVGGKILSMLINPLMWITTIVYFVLRSQFGPFIESFFPAPVFYMAAISLVAGNFLYSYYYMLGAAKRKQWELITSAFLTPVYWLGMSTAAVYAVFELIVRPFYWQKTKHGLHLKQEVKEPVFARNPRQKISLAPTP